MAKPKRLLRLVINAISGANEEFLDIDAIVALIPDAEWTKGKTPDKSLRNVLKDTRYFVQRGSKYGLNCGGRPPQYLGAGSIGANGGPTVAAPGGTSRPTTSLPEAIDSVSPPNRCLASVYRILRDTELAREVKRRHRFRCQVCGSTIVLPSGECYAESHHIQPLGRPHDGPDVMDNILCVCPNHHAELDYGVLLITPSLLLRSPDHRIDQKYIDYHNGFWADAKGR
jgi:hypothetical protein